MSNGLLRAANRVSGLPAMARQVLAALADDARDAAGGRSRLTTAQIADRTGLSRRSIHRAYVFLIDAGHITRSVPAPGEYPETMVHPVARNAAAGSDLPDADLAEGPATVSAPPCQPVRGSIDHRNIPVNHSPRASAREADFDGFSGPVPEGVPVAPPPPVPRELEPVDQVFAAWDAWRDRAGLPGPVTRNPARRVAVARAIEANGLGKVLMMVDTVERAVRAGQFRRKGAEGQDSIWATFDAAFEVGHAAGLNLLARLLDGEFGAVVPAAAPVPEPSADYADSMHDPDQRLRAALRRSLGEHHYDAWIAPLTFERRAGELLAIAPGAFVADWVAGHYLDQLRGAAGGLPVRVMVREKV